MLSPDHIILPLKFLMLRLCYSCQPATALADQCEYLGISEQGDWGVGEWALGLLDGPVRSLRLERTSKVIKSKHQPITAIPPYHVCSSSSPLWAHCSPVRLPGKEVKDGKAACKITDTARTIHVHPSVWVFLSTLGCATT